MIFQLLPSIVEGGGVRFAQQLASRSGAQAYKALSRSAELSALQPLLCNGWFLHGGGERFAQQLQSAAEPQPKSTGPQGLKSQRRTFGAPAVAVQRKGFCAREGGAVCTAIFFACGKEIEE